MLIDRSHKNWIIFTAVATALCTGHYVIYRHNSYQMGGNGPSGASITGLIYGILGFIIMTFCGLLGVRRKVRVWRLGRAETWLRAHLWLGLLSFPVILVHSGMKMGHQLSLWAMLVFVAVEVTGIFGVFMQQLIPRSMLYRVTAETTYEQIPAVIASLRREADALVTGVCGPLSNDAAPAAEAAPPPGIHAGIKKDGAVQGRVVKSKGKPSGPIEGSGPLKTFYLTEVQPFLGQKFLGNSRLGTPKGSTALFSHIRTLLPDALHETVTDLEWICDERRQLATQVRLHYWLHGWEFIHIPLAYALLVLTLVHIAMATFRYSGFLNR